MDTEGFVSINTLAGSSGVRRASRYSTCEMIAIRTEKTTYRNEDRYLLSVVLSSPLLKSMGWVIGDSIAVLANPTTKFLLLTKQVGGYRLSPLSSAGKGIATGTVRPAKVSFVVPEGLGLLDGKLDATAADFQVVEGSIFVEIPDALLADPVEVTGADVDLPSEIGLAA